MQGFQAGPFEFSPTGRAIVVNGQPMQRWAMTYGAKKLGDRTLPAVAGRNQVVEAFADDKGSFVRAHQPHSDPAARNDRDGYTVRLVQSTDRVGVHGRELGRFVARAPIDGLSAGLIDDRFPAWLIADELSASTPMDEQQFRRLQAAHEAIAETQATPPVQPPSAPPMAWLCELLPDDVMTSNPDEWRAPSSWEIRHVVGEDSFTGISGAAASALVGVQPQGFRKYTARDGAASRQNISFAMWHLLLHKLGVKNA